MDFELPPPPFDLPELAEDAPLWVRNAHRNAEEFAAPSAWVRMGLAFETGTGVEQDGEKAAKAYRHAFENHETDYAPLLLSRLYGLGEVGALSPALADHYARIAAMHSGDRFLGEKVERTFWPVLPDDWVPRKRLRAALDWLKERHDWSKEDQYALSLAYEAGNAVPQSNHMAYFWLSKAATGLNPDIQYAFGKCLLRGYCVADVPHPDPSRIMTAETRLLLAAGLGRHPGASVMLGEEYLSGKSLRQDPARAYVWFMQAKRLGAEIPVDLDALKGHLSDKDRKQAKKWLNGPTELPP